MSGHAQVVVKDVIGEPPIWALIYHPETPERLPGLAIMRVKTVRDWRGRESPILSLELKNDNEAHIMRCWNDMKRGISFDKVFAYEVG